VNVFTHENKNITDLEPKYQSNDSFNISCTTHIIGNKLKRLKVKKSPGPDGFHPRVLSEISPSINLPLRIICTKSCEKGYLQSDWKNAHITLIDKKGSKAILENYRPVILTSVIGKMMEPVIRDSLVNNMMDHNLFCDQQHAYLNTNDCT